MAERNPPAWLQGGSHPADLDRLLIDTLLPTGGVIDKDGGHLLVTEQATASMGVTVAAGRVVIPGTESADQGVYHAFNDAPVDKNVAASDPSNPRIDLVVARVGDVFYDAGASGEWEVQVVTGVAEATPSEPAVPDNAHVLARIDVGAGVSTITNAAITDRRAQTRVRSVLLDERPAGVLDYAEVTAGQSGISTNTDLTGLSATVDLPAGRRIRVTGKGEVQQKTSGGVARGRMQEGTTELNNWLWFTLGADDRAIGESSAILTPTAGVHTYKMTLDTSSGTVDLIAAAGRPAFILVEDLGPA